MQENITISASFRLMGENKLFGPGIAALLEGVARTGSLRQSAMAMNMSYNKAFRIVRDCEAQLGFPLLTRFKGGTGGGGAQLTPQGTQLLADYQSFKQEAETMLAQLSNKYFAWLTKKEK